MNPKQIASQSASTEVSAEETLNPASAAIRDMAEMSLSLVIVDEETRKARLAQASKTVSVLAFLNQKTDVARVEMLNALTATRLMFPATEKVRAIMGEDAPDLIGATDEYTTAIGEVYASARKLLASRFRRDGYIGDLAENLAEARVESLRKSVSLDYRKHMELVARQQDNPAAFLLGHGFGFNTAVGSKKSPQAIPAKTSIVLRAEDGTLHVGREGDVLVPGAEKGQWALQSPATKVGDATEANEPADQGDQANPSEQADATEKELADAIDTSLGNPAERIHFVISNLRTVAGDPRWGTLSGGQRVAETKAVFEALGDFLTASVAGLTERQRSDVLRSFKHMGAAFLTATSPAVEDASK